MTATPRSTVRGRDAELSQLGEALEKLRRGHSVVVVIRGEAGLGKSRMLAEARRMAERLSIASGLGETEPSDAVVELAPLLRALFDGPEPLLDRSALPDGHAGAEQRYWLVQDLAGLLERRVADGPILVCLDDLQWADGGTLAALRTLPAQLGSLPIGWALAARPIDPGAAPAHLLRRLEALGDARIDLAPLSAGDVAMLAATVLEATPDAPVLELADQAQGNPFLLVEILQGLREERLVRVKDGRAVLVEARVPARVGVGLRHRLARLSESARQLAVTGASLGRAFTLGQLATMLASPPATLLPAVEQLLQAGLLQERDERLTFRHDLVREALRDLIPASGRRALDRQAVDVLLAERALPVEVALQLAASAEPGDQPAIRVLADAAVALSERDPGAAAKLARRALGLRPAAPELTRRLASMIVVLLHASGQTAAARAFAEDQLRDILPPRDEAALCLSLASMFALSPDVRARAGRRALALRGLDPEQRARHEARLVYNLVQAGRRDEAGAALQPARDAVNRDGDATARAVLAQAEAVLIYTEGRFRDALAAHEQVMRDGFGEGEESRLWVARQWRAELLGVLDRFEDSLALLRDGIVTASRERHAFAVEFLEVWLGRQLVHTGRLADAAALLETHLSDPAARAPAGALYAAGVVAYGQVCLHTGDERRRRALTRIAEAMAGNSTPVAGGHGAWLLALDAMADSRPADARAALDTGGTALYPLYPLDPTDDPQVVRIGLAAGDAELADRAVAAAEQRARRTPGVATLDGAALHARGLRDRSAHTLTEAVRRFEAGPRPLALASALEDLGTIESLQRALTLYADAGATWDASRVRRRLRRRGVRRRLVHREDRPPTGFEALTESELAVVARIAGGMTNREASEALYLSPHTVSTHLRHAFGKLGINSRVELARIVEGRTGSANASHRTIVR